MKIYGCAVFLALLAVAYLPQAAQAQQPQTQTQVAPPDTTVLVFEREVFNYPTFARRNPFQPLSAMSASGPNFESLRLNGVTFSDNPALSVASLGVGTATPSGAGSGGYQSYRVRVGQTIGNSRVLEIHRGRVVFEVEEFGVRERRTLEVMKPTPAATTSDTIPENGARLPDGDGDVPPDSVPIPNEGDLK